MESIYTFEGTFASVFAWGSPHRLFVDTMLLHYYRKP